MGQTTHLLRRPESAAGGSSFLRAQNELVRRRAGEEAERNEGRAQAGREVQLAAGVWETDLAGMEMTREHQVEDARLEPVDHLGEVAQKDAEIRVRVREPFRL